MKEDQAVKRLAALALAITLSVSATIAFAAPTGEGAGPPGYDAGPPSKPESPRGGSSDGLVSEVYSMVLETPLESTPGSAVGGALGFGFEGYEGIFPSGAWQAFDNDGTTNGEYYWDDDDYRPNYGSWSAWCANGGANGLDPASSNYANNMSSWMVYGPFSLAGCSEAEL